MQKNFMKFGLVVIALTFGSTLSAQIASQISKAVSLDLKEYRLPKYLGADSARAVDGEITSLTKGQIDQSWVTASRKIDKMNVEQQLKVVKRYGQYVSIMTSESRTIKNGNITSKAYNFKSNAPFEGPNDTLVMELNTHAVNGSAPLHKVVQFHLDPKEKGEIISYSTNSDLSTFSVTVLTPAGKVKRYGYKVKDTSHAEKTYGVPNTVLDYEQRTMVTLENGLEDFGAGNSLRTESSSPVGGMNVNSSGTR